MIPYPDSDQWVACRTSGAVGRGDRKWRRTPRGYAASRWCALPPFPCPWVPLFFVWEFNIHKSQWTKCTMYTYRKDAHAHRPGCRLGCASAAGAKDTWGCAEWAWSDTIPGCCCAAALDCFFLFCFEFSLQQPEICLTLNFFYICI